MLSGDHSNVEFDVVEHSIWNSDIENLFLPSKLKAESANKLPARKRNTSHRLLTCDDIIEEKRMIQDKKEKKEEMKKARELKRLSKKDKNT